MKTVRSHGRGEPRAGAGAGGGSVTQTPGSVARKHSDHEDTTCIITIRA